MARKPTEETRELQRRAHDVLTHAGRGAELRLKEIAEALGVDTKTLSNALPVRGKIVRVRYGTYAAWTPKVVELAPTPRRVVAHSLDGTKLVDEQITNVGAKKAPTFRFLLVVGDGEVLLQDNDKNVWKATLL